MRFSIHFLAGLLLLIFTSCFSLTFQEENPKLKLHARRYAEAYFNNNGKILYEYYPKSLVESSGGKDSFINLINSQNESLKRNGLVLKEVNIESPSKYWERRGEIHCILPFQTVLYTLKNTVTINSSIYCVSKNNGVSWIFLEYNQFKQLFPDFDFRFHPVADYEVQEQPCNYFQIDVFGEKICLDRYIDSGEYVALECNERYGCKLVRKNKPEHLTYFDLDLIDEAIQKWKSEAGITCCFPDISRGTVLYLESNVGIISSYNSYGVPFFYFREKRIIHDTIIGSLSFDRQSAYKELDKTRFENIYGNTFDIRNEPSDYLN